MLQLSSEHTKLKHDCRKTKIHKINISKSMNNRPFDRSERSLYHYTDMNALVNIINNDQIVLWATNCLFLNDSNEIIEGTKSIERILNKTISPDFFDNFYITSFSNIPDQLNMWGMYASNGNGCAIGFDYNILLKSYDAIMKCIYGEKNIDNTLSSFLELCNNGSISQITNTQDNKNTFEKTLNQIRDNLTNITVISSCLAAKHEAFINEQETRCIVKCLDNKLIKFRAKNGILIPFLEIMIPKEALTSITIGPTNKSALAIQSIRYFLTKRGYDLNQVKLITSKIPYRG